REQLVHARAAVENIADFQRRQLRGVLLRKLARMEGPDTLQLLHVGRRDLAELRIALRALAAAIGAPLTLLGRIRGVLEECVSPRVRQGERRRLLIRDRDENRERAAVGADRDQAQLAHTPTARRIECGSNQNPENEEDEGRDETRDQ